MGKHNVPPMGYCNVVNYWVPSSQSWTGLKQEAPRFPPILKNSFLCNVVITSEPEKVPSISTKCENAIRYQSLVKNNIAFKSSQN